LSFTFHSREILLPVDLSLAVAEVKKETVSYRSITPTMAGRSILGVPGFARDASWTAY
jgi:hypothetical protein